MMSSEASTEEGLVAPKRDSANGRLSPKRDSAEGLVSPKRESAEADALQPWQLFTLAGLIGATVVVFFSRGQSPIGIVLLSAAVFAAAFVGLSALRTFLPLTGSVPEDRPDMLGGRTRAALERDKALVLRTIKELEFDRGMGKVSEKDFAEMSARLRVRAGRIIRQLDAGSLYREQIEKEVEQRVAAANAGSAPRNPAYAAEKTPSPAGRATAGPVAVCPSCNTQNDPDARFCKSCGARLGTT
jgi:hypothetical protein